MLEARLGTRLLHRTTRSVAPRASGAAVQAARAVVPRHRGGGRGASAATGHTSGTLRINTLGMAAWEVIAPGLGEPNQDPILDATGMPFEAFRSNKPPLSAIGMYIWLPLLRPAALILF